MDDLIERLRETASRVLGTRARFPFGVGGQTVEASAKGEMHDISAWDAEIMHEAADRIATLTRERDEAVARVAVLEAALQEWTTARYMRGLSFNTFGWQEYRDINRLARAEEALAALAAPQGAAPIGILDGERRFDWPYYDSYVSRCSCGTQFGGPKRAVACWSCLSDRERQAWRDRHAAPQGDSAGTEG